MKIDAIWTPEVQQNIFRKLLTAFAKPAKVLDLSELLTGATALEGILATLVDSAVNLSDPDGLIYTQTRHLLQTVSCRPEKAAYIVADGSNPPGFTPYTGTLESPEFGTTVILVVTQVGRGSYDNTFTGPGIDGEQPLAVEGLHPQWLENRNTWNQAFPLGVDMLLADRHCIAALPRTTKIKLRGG